MNQTEAFFSALEEWKTATRAEVNEYGILLFRISQSIGAVQNETTLMDDSDRLALIQKRIKELIGQGMKEDFVITSLVNFIKEEFEDVIIAIANWSDPVFNKIEDEGEITPDSAEMLKEALDIKHYTKAKEELDAWKSITAYKLGRSKRKLWEFEKMSRKSSNH